MTSVIEVEKLTKVYGSRRAVDRLSFDVRSGEVFAFLGPNGAGKTTTVEILEGVRHLTDGEARVLGLDPWTQMDGLRPRIGVVPQDFHFFPRLTPREALRLYGRLFERSPDIEGILKAVQLVEKADDYFETLSGGEQRKVGVALALANDPEICFLDEPTTGLDPRARRSIWEVIRHLRTEGRSVFLTTHYLDEAQQLADRIAIIDHGRLVAIGPPEDIIATFGRPERLRITGDPSLVDRLTALGFPVTRESDGVEVELRTKADALTILQALLMTGVSWESFSTRTDTLEDVFIRLIGPQVEENGESSPASEVAA